MEEQRAISMIVYDAGGSMKIATAKEIGQIIRQKRKDDGLTLEDAAALCGVSYAFLSALENGKETVRLDKVLHVAASLGIEFEAHPRGWSSTGSAA